MNTLAVVSFAVLLAVANAGLHAIEVGVVGPSEHGTVVQGPSSHADVVGPDGSHISAVARGGTVVAAGHHGGVVSSAVAPGLVAVAHAAPVVHAAPLVAAAPVAVGYGLVGHGFEGQYVPSGLELLHDDGSYRAEHHLAEHLHY